MGAASAAGTKGPGAKPLANVPSSRARRAGVARIAGGETAAADRRRSKTTPIKSNRSDAVAPPATATTTASTAAVAREATAGENAPAPPPPPPPRHGEGDSPGKRRRGRRSALRLGAAGAAGEMISGGIRILADFPRWGMETGPLLQHLESHFAPTFLNRRPGYHNRRTSYTEG